MKYIYIYIYIYIFADYFTAVAVFPSTVSILPFCNNILQQGSLFPLLLLYDLSSLVLPVLVYTSPVVPILVQMKYRWQIMEVI
jgi:hypothetical protein